MFSTPLVYPSNKLIVWSINKEMNVGMNVWMNKVECGEMNEWTKICKLKKISLRNDKIKNIYYVVNYCSHS